MNYFVYILISESTQGFYIGQTSGLKKRLQYHNGNRVKSTKNKGPWRFLYTRKLESIQKALILERKLKNLKSRKRILVWISNHLDEDSSVGPKIFSVETLSPPLRCLPTGMAEMLENLKAVVEYADLLS